MTAPLTARLTAPLAALLSVSVGVGTLSLPASVHAAPADGDDEVAPIDTEARAMEFYNDGKAAYDAGEYERALTLFLDAQSLYPSPVFHYNIALCHESLDNLEQAVISYQAYLRSYKNAFGEDPEDKVNTENKIARIQELLELRANETDKPDEPPPVEPPPLEPLPEDEPAKPGRGLVITGGVLTGLGAGVAVIGGVLFGTRAAGISNQLEDVYEGGNPERVTLDEARSLDADGRAAELNQILTISIGAAVGLTGIALLAAGVAKRKRAAGASAQVLPSAGPGGAGIVIHGRF